MFIFIAASLGKCTFIRREYEGQMLSKHSNIQPPALRIITDNDKEIFIDVKNYNLKDTDNCVILREEQYKRITNYCNMFKKDLKIAIYWSRWNYWTLIPLDKLKCTGSKYTISFKDAKLNNEMNILGDEFIAISPSLKLQLAGDSSNPCILDEQGKSFFRISSFDIFNKGTLIEDQLEKNLAMYLMLFGNWSIETVNPVLDGKELKALTYEAAPLMEMPGQNLEMIGSLSEILSNQFKFPLNAKGTAIALSPGTDTDTIKVKIPLDYEGKTLKISRFPLRPEIKK
jgi:Holliday junction resolvase